MKPSGFPIPSSTILILRELAKLSGNGAGQEESGAGAFSNTVNHGVETFFDQKNYGANTSFPLKNYGVDNFSYAWETTGRRPF